MSELVSITKLSREFKASPKVVEQALAKHNIAPAHKLPAGRGIMRQYTNSVVDRAVIGA